MRGILALVGLALVAAACGGGASTPAGDPASTPPTEGPTSATEAPATGTPSTVAEAPSATEAPAATQPRAAQGPPAPDFTLTLSDGEPFTLSAQSKPVYMVFWAEW